MHIEDAVKKIIDYIEKSDQSKLEDKNINSG